MSNFLLEKFGVYFYVKDLEIGRNEIQRGSLKVLVSDEYNDNFMFLWQNIFKLILKYELSMLFLS